MLSGNKYITFLFIISSTLFSSLYASHFTDENKKPLFITQDTIPQKSIKKDTIKPWKIKEDTIQSISAIQDSINLIGTIKDSLVAAPLDTLNPNKLKTQDSIPIIRDSFLVEYFTARIDSFALGKIHRLDTSLSGIQNYDPTYQAGSYYANLGNVGLPAKNLRFKPQISEGFNYRYSPLDIHTYTNENVKYYRLFRPFTELYYVSGPKKENNLRVIHSQNISRGLNVGINFKFINAPGLYEHQRSDNKNLYVTARYSTRNGRYGFIANYIHDKLIIEENGGLVNDSAFTFSLEVNRKLIAVNLQQAKNTLKKGSIYLNQYFNIGRAPYITTDTLGQKSRHQGLPLGQLSHTLSIERKSFIFEDTKDQSAYYNKFDEILNPTNAFDSTRILRIENQVKWSNLGYEIQPEDKPIYVYFGIKQLHTEVYDTIARQSFNNMIPKAGISTFLFKSFRLNVDGFYVLGDHNDGNYSLQANIRQFIGNKDRNYGLLNLRAEIAKQSPSWFYNLYHGNYLRWETDFSAEKYLILQADYSYKGITAGINYQKIDNYIFMDKTAHPKQTEITQSIFTATLDVKKRLGDFSMDAHLIYQKPKSDSLLRVPEFHGSISFYYTRSLFQNATTVQPGIEIFYNTAYFADAYMPATRSFHLQNMNRIGNAFYADLYLNFTIKNTLLFFKYQHFNAAVTGYNYFLVPHYPMPDYAIKFGVIWKFID
ncbi:MAG: putative porin [Bacteroidetes bacterium]|nr:putative porin [Bacteroidota bacterium]